jgi:hypothetical protein
MSELNPTRWKTVAEITVITKNRIIRKLKKISSFLHKQ